MGRVRAIDRDLKLQKPQVKDVMAEFLPRNRLPLALYEVFPEFFDVESDERLKKRTREERATPLLYYPRLQTTRASP